MGRNCRAGSTTAVAPVGWWGAAADEAARAASASEGAAGAGQHGPFVGSAGARRPSFSASAWRSARCADADRVQEDADRCRTSESAPEGRGAASRASEGASGRCRSTASA